MGDLAANRKGTFNRRERVSCSGSVTPKMTSASTAVGDEPLTAIPLVVLLQLVPRFSAGA